MNLDLFSNGLFVCLGILNTALIYYLFQELIKHREIKKLLPYITATTLLLSVALLVAVKFVFPSDKLPPNLWLMVLPFGLSGALLGICMWLHKLRIGLISTANVVISLLVSLLLANSYYHYYPTLYSVFGAQDVKNRQNITIVSQQKKSNWRPSSTERQLYGSSASTKGSISSISIPGAISHFRARPGYLYTPAINAGSNKVQLPVIVLMAGVPGNPQDWLNGGGLQTTMDQFAALHHGITPYVFVLDNLGSSTNDTECVDSPRGNVDTYLGQDVPTYIKAHFRVATSPDQWAIGGLSLGGLCGLTITLRHDNVYHYFLDFSGEIGPEVGSKQKTIQTLFGGSQAKWQEYQPLQLLHSNKYPHVSGFFAVGKNDKLSLVNGINTLHKETQAAGIESVLQLMVGEHTFNVWQQSFKDALPWVSNRLGATECSGSCY